MVENFRVHSCDGTAEDSFGFESMVNSCNGSMINVIGYLQNMLQMPLDIQPQFYITFQKWLKTPFEWPCQSDHCSQNDRDSMAEMVSYFVRQQRGRNFSQNERDSMAEMVRAMKRWQAFAGAVDYPGSISSLFKGIDTMPDIFTDFACLIMSALSEVHQKIVESVSSTGERADGYHCNNIDETLFNIWGKIYEKEFRKFLHIPQLGMAREYLEKSNDMTDKFNMVQNHLSDFLRILSIPFQRSVVVVQEKIHALAEKGELSEDPRFYYQMWIRSLEGHFMNLFQTPEYIEALSNTLTAMSRFVQSREKVLEDMLHSIPVARRSEMDDLSREFHQLKKEVRLLKKRELLRELPQNRFSHPTDTFSLPGVKPS